MADKLCHIIRQVFFPLSGRSWGQHQWIQNGNKDLVLSREEFWLQVHSLNWVKWPLAGASWCCHSDSSVWLWLSITGADDWVIFPSSFTMVGGGMLAFTLLGEVLVGLLPPFLRAYEICSGAVAQVHWTCSWLNGRTAGGQGRALCLVLCWHQCGVRMASWAPPGPPGAAGGRQGANSGSIQRRTCLQAKGAPGK